MARLQCRVPEPTRRVHLFRLPDAERAETIGPCSLCGMRSVKWPREWGLDVTHLDEPLGEDNPMHYVVCSRCHCALWELGETCFGDSLQGVLEFQGDAPYWHVGR
jgi:hypothetical protein